MYPVAAHCVQLRVTRPTNHRPILVCRVRALAAALGVGTAVTLGTAGVACADAANPPSAGGTAGVQTAEAGPARRSTGAPATSAAHRARNSTPAAGVAPHSTRVVAAPIASPAAMPAQPQLPKVSVVTFGAMAAMAGDSGQSSAAAKAATAVASYPVAPVTTIASPSQAGAIAVAFQTLPEGGGNGIPSFPAEFVTPVLALVRRQLQNGVPDFGLADNMAPNSAAFTSRSRKVALPKLTISDASAAEGNTGTANMAFTVTLSQVSGAPVLVGYSTSNGTATAVADYLASSGTITFTPGQISKTVNISVVGDTAIELNETFTVTLSKPSHATLARAVGTGTIVNDDVAPPPATGSQWGNAFFSPYVSMSNWPVPNLLQLSQASGASRINIGFIQADSAGKPSWGGYSVLQPTSTNSQAVAINQSITDFKAAAGDAMISFGGAVGTSLSQYYSANKLSAQALADTYANVANAYALTHLDFDIEGAALSDRNAVTLQTQAIKLLQLAHPNLQVWLTLPVTPTGLTSDSINAVTSALQAGVKLAGVNVMAMDYGEYAAPTSGPNAQTMGTYAIDAAQSTYLQLSALYNTYGLTYGWSQLGVTPMIGVNDVTSEVFTLTDAQALESFAEAKGLGMLSMWSLLRDNPGTLGQVSESTSGMNYPADSFSKVFDIYGTTNRVS